MISLIKVNQKNPSDIINDIKTGKIHIVCMAQNGLTHLNVYAELYYKMSKEIVDQCVNLSNSRKETMSFYPEAFISILPKSERQSEWNNAPVTLNKSELRNCIEDVFIANQTYFKSEIIYFSLEGHYVDLSEAFHIIEGIITKNRTNDLYVKEVWFERNF